MVEPLSFYAPGLRISPDYPQLVFKSQSELHQHCLDYTSEYINAVHSMRSLTIAFAVLIIVCSLYLLWWWYGGSPKTKREPQVRGETTDSNAENK